jgi:hypothetical protein
MSNPTAKVNHHTRLIHGRDTNGRIRYDFMTWKESYINVLHGLWDKCLDVMEDRYDNIADMTKHPESFEKFCLMIYNRSSGNIEDDMLPEFYRVMYLPIYISRLDT